MQYLTLPSAFMKATAGYKNKAYLNHYGYVHYGIDTVSYKSEQSRVVFALGNGRVIAADCDGPNGDASKGCGNVLVIEYDDCYNWKDKKTYNIVATIMHMAKINVRKGDFVTAKTQVGIYGETGAMCDGVHIHLQFDLDTKHPLYCTGISSKGHALLKKGTTDSTVNPCYFLHKAEGQIVKAEDSIWFTKSDFSAIPDYPKKKITYEVRNYNGALLAQFGTKAEAEKYIKGMTINEV